MVEFSYSGELTFTTTNFAKMKQAIRELKMKNIDEESLLKIEEDIEQTNEGIQNCVGWPRPVFWSYKGFKSILRFF